MAYTTGMDYLNDAEIAKAAIEYVRAFRLADRSGRYRSQTPRGAELNARDRLFLLVPLSDEEEASYGPSRLTREP